MRLYLPFDYRLPVSNAGFFNLYFVRNGVEHVVGFNDPVGYFQFSPWVLEIGSLIPEVISDGAWHHLEFNLLAFLKSKYPGDSNFQVDKIFLGAWKIDPL